MYFLDLYFPVQIFIGLESNFWVRLEVMRKGIIFSQKVMSKVIHSTFWKN